MLMKHIGLGTLNTTASAGENPIATIEDIYFTLKDTSINQVLDCDSEHLVYVLALYSERFKFGNNLNELDDVLRQHLSKIFNCVQSNSFGLLNTVRIAFQSLL